MLVVIDQDLKNFLVTLSLAQIRVMGKGIYWVNKLTAYTKKRMQYHTAPRTTRASGKLSKSMVSKVSASAGKAYGIVYVPEGIKYQFLQEFGRKNKIEKAIPRSGGKYMRFPIQNWKKGMRNPSISKLAHNGYFVFYKVAKGKVKGKFFTRKSFDDLLRFYAKRQANIIREIGDTIIFGGSYTRGL